MKIFGYEIRNLKAKVDQQKEEINSAPSSDPHTNSQYSETLMELGIRRIGLKSNDVYDRADHLTGVGKAYIPKFMYKPPFGYPRTDNIAYIKQTARNPYVHAVVNLLKNEAASNKWDIVLEDDDIEMTDELKATRHEIIKFLKSPNDNKETFTDLVKKAIQDLCELDTGIWVKSFNRMKQMVSIYAYDGGSFLKNPDIHGRLGARADVILPEDTLPLETMDTQKEQLQYYQLTLNEKAAYYQYGWTNAQIPVPFGLKEVVWFMANPRADGIYGRSPVQVLADVIYLLIYGGQYNLDFYMQGNMPEGLLSILGSDPREAKAVKERLENVTRAKDPNTGWKYKVGYKIPVTSYDAKFIPFTMPSKDMEIIEQQKWFSTIVWMCFGVTPDDMGVTDNSNKAVSESMERRYAKKAVRPLLQIIEERINSEILPEFEGTEQLAFKFDDYDMQEDMTKHKLYQMQINMGIKTPEMVAAEENIDLAELEASQMKRQEKEVAKAEAMNQANPMDQDKSAIQAPSKEVEKNAKKGMPQKEEPKGSVKGFAPKSVDPFADSVLEQDLTEEIETKANALMAALQTYKAGSLSNVR